MKITKILVLLCCLPAWISADTRGTVVWFMEQEAGGEPYRVRYIVTDDYLRSDEGGGEEGFLLFDRRKHQVFSVVPENETILQIDGRGEAPLMPEGLTFEVKESVDDKAPSVAGEKPLALELVANGEVCHSAIVVPQFLDQARQALQELSRALVVQQVRTLANTPREYQTPCFLARYLYAADFYLRTGFPLADWNSSRNRRELLSYENDVELDARLFELPEGLATMHAAGD